MQFDDVKFLSGPTRENEHRQLNWREFSALLAADAKNHGNFGSAIIRAFGNGRGLQVY
jgi:hypothetical protein